jgi:hypothetical protein
MPSDALCSAMKSVTAGGEAAPTVAAPNILDRENFRE